MRPHMILTALALLIVAAGAEVMASRHVRAVATPPSWANHLRAMEDALTRDDVSVATRAWSAAYAAALASRHWEGLVAVGDASLEIANVGAARDHARGKAREAYLHALFRARKLDALDGVLQATEAFARLGDRDVVLQSLRMAERLAERHHDPLMGARVAAAAERAHRALTVHDLAR